MKINDSLEEVSTNDRNQSADVVDHLVERLSTSSQRLAQATEDQARQPEQRTRDLVDRAEAATERVVDTIDRELRTQIAELRRDIERATFPFGTVDGRGRCATAQARALGSGSSVGSRAGPRWPGAVALLVRPSVPLPTHFALNPLRLAR